MVCPYCKNIMESGFIQSSRPILWSNKEKKVFVSPNKSRGDIPITKLSNLTSKEAFYCKICNNVIVSGIDDV